METASDRLKAARIAAGYESARAAAIHHNWNPNTYKAHEAGLNGFKPIVAAEYASAFGASAAWLLMGEGEAPQPSSKPPQRRQDLPPPNASGAFRRPDLWKRDLPVYGVGVGGDDGKFQFNGEAIDYVSRPDELIGVNGAYAVFVSGESMSPRYEPGETVWCHPGRPPRRGDDVVVQLHPEEKSDPPEGYIKRFVSWMPSHLVLSQFNPAGEIEFDRKLVRSVHVIIGSLKN